MLWIRLWAASEAFHVISTAVAGPAVGTAELRGDVRAPALAALLDHRVAGRLLAPGAALLEMAACAGRLITGKI